MLLEANRYTALCIFENGSFDLPSKRCIEGHLNQRREQIGDKQLRLKLEINRGEHELMLMKSKLRKAGHQEAAARPR